MSKWYIMYNGQPVGPMTVDQLFSYGLNPNSQVWTEGMTQWAAVYTIPDLMSRLNGQAANNGYSPYPGCPPANFYQEYGTSGKSKTTAGILALLIGGLGIQYFYVGKTTAGILTIFINLVTCGIWGIVMFIQGILMLTMSQQEFERKYVYTQNNFPLF